MNAGRPFDIDLSFIGGAQSEMQTFIARRFIASRCGGKARLAIHLHPRTQSIAVAARAPQRDGEPVRAATAIVIKLRMRSEDSRYNIDPAIIIDVSESRAAARDQSIAAGIHALEAPITIHRQQ